MMRPVGFYRGYHCSRSLAGSNDEGTTGRLYRKMWWQNGLSLDRSNGSLEGPMQELEGIHETIVLLR
jgi:hypothetical protein